MLDRINFSDRSPRLHYQHLCTQDVKSSASCLAAALRHCHHIPAHVGGQVDELAAQRQGVKSMEPNCKGIRQDMHQVAILRQVLLGQGMAIMLIQTKPEETSTQVQLCSHHMYASGAQHLLQILRWLRARPQSLPLCVFARLPSKTPVQTMNGAHKPIRQSLRPDVAVRVRMQLSHEPVAQVRIVLYLSRI